MKLMKVYEFYLAEKHEYGIALVAAENQDEALDVLMAHFRELYSRYDSFLIRKLWKLVTKHDDLISNKEKPYVILFHFEES